MRILPDRKERGHELTVYRDMVTQMSDTFEKWQVKGT
jgi:hypothetical protein